MKGKVTSSPSHPLERNSDEPSDDIVKKLGVGNRVTSKKNESKGFSTFKQCNKSKIASLCSHILTYGTRMNKKEKRVINTEFIYPNRIPNSKFVEQDNFLKVFIKHSLFESCPSLLEMLFTFSIYERSELIRVALENAVAHLIDYKGDVDLEGIPFLLKDDNVSRTYKDDIEADHLLNTVYNYICTFGIKTDNKGNRVLDSEQIFTSNSQIVVSPSFFKKDVSLLRALEKLPKETTEIVLIMVFDALFYAGVRKRS